MIEIPSRCASGCVAECLTSNREVAGSNLRTKVYPAFHPSGVGKWVPATAGKAKTGKGQTGETQGETQGVQVKL